VSASRWASPLAIAATVAVAAGFGVLALVGAREGAAGPAAGAAAPAALGSGSDLFQAKGCVGCHDGPDDARSQFDIAPDLRLLPTVADHRVAGLGGRDYVRQSLQEPQAFVVPGYDPSDHALMPALPLSPAEVDALVAFLLP
jgi:hypothetical protein